MASNARREAQSYGRTAGLLTVALGTAGALAYLFFAVASHSLDKEEYGRIVVLWSVSFLIISTLFRPVEQLLSRTIAELRERGQSIQHAGRVAASIQIGIAVLFTGLIVSLRSPVEEELFDGDALLFWTLVGTVLAFSASYFARGFFAGCKRMGAYAALLIVEGATRLGLALLVAVGIASGPDLITIAIAIAPAASLLVVPVAIGRSTRPVEATVSPHVEGAEGLEAASKFTLARGGGFAAAVLLIMLSEQVLLNSGVLFVRAAEDAAAAGFIFNVLMVARAPVVLFQAIAASLLPHLTALHSRDDETSEEAFKLSVRLTVGVIACFTGAVAIGLLAIGPEVMQIAFGENFEYDRGGLLIVAGGMGLYLTAATLSQAALAHGQVKRAAACWATSAAVFAAINLSSVLDAFRRVELGFAISAALLCACLYAVYRSPPETGDELLPGSPSELEVRLATADDVL